MKVITNKKNTTEWDKIAKRFDTHKNIDDIHPDAAVNLVVGWPVIFNIIEDHQKFLGKSTCNILDFGCGAGALCKELHKKGHTIVGMDASENMLQMAREHLSDEIDLYKCCNNLNKVPEDLISKFDVITAMHSLDWIEDIESILGNLVYMLKKNGLLLFAVFPKKHVIDSLRIKDLFEDFDSFENPAVGFANFDGIRVPVYVREASFYDVFLGSMGLDKVLEYYPPYPKDFFKKYKWTGSHYPEMMILGYINR